MPIYNVHIYREMRLLYPRIEAASAEQAAQIAAENRTSYAESIEDCEGQTLAALVDLEGDDEHIHSKIIDFEAPTPRSRQEIGASKIMAGFTK
jgi:hypothetical protein